MEQLADELKQGIETRKQGPSDFGADPRYVRHLVEDQELLGALERKLSGS